MRINRQAKKKIIELLATALKEEKRKDSRLQNIRVEKGKLIITVMINAKPQVVELSLQEGQTL